MSAKGLRVSPLLTNLERFVSQPKTLSMQSLKQASPKNFKSVDFEPSWIFEMLASENKADQFSRRRFPRDLLVPMIVMKEGDTQFQCLPENCAVVHNNFALRRKIPRVYAHGLRRVFDQIQERFVDSSHVNVFRCEKYTKLTSKLVPASFKQSIQGYPDCKVFLSTQTNAKYVANKLQKMQALCKRIMTEKHLVVENGSSVAPNLIVLNFGSDSDEYIEFQKVPRKRTHATVLNVKKFGADVRDYLVSHNGEKYASKYMDAWHSWGFSRDATSNETQARIALVDQGDAREFAKEFSRVINYLVVV